MTNLEHLIKKAITWPIFELGSRDLKFSMVVDWDIWNIGNFRNSMNVRNFWNVRNDVNVRLDKQTPSVIHFRNHKLKLI